jgi:hypothetical protein
VGFSAFTGWREGWHAMTEQEHRIRLDGSMIGPKPRPTLELTKLVLPTEAEVVGTAPAATERIIELPTQREALARATSLEERLQIKYGPLDPKLLTALMAASRGRPYKVRSGGYDYHFYIYRKASRLVSFKKKVALVPGVEKLHTDLTASYTCPTCNVTFDRNGTKRRYCSEGCKVKRRTRKRNGTHWTATNLSPEAKAKQAVAADQYERRADALDRAARREQKSHLRDSPPDRTNE